jgi:hypothetical protein
MAGLPRLVAQYWWTELVRVAFLFFGLRCPLAPLARWSERIARSYCATPTGDALNVKCSCGRYLTTKAGERQRRQENYKSAEVQKLLQTPDKF